MKSNGIKYPVGIQTFGEIISEGYLYVDKTALIHELVNTEKYVFLSRPRRFGKSLLVSTVEEYFRGNRELFAGLAVSRLESEWTEYPVIRIDFTGENYQSPEKLLGKIDALLRHYEDLYGLPEGNMSVALRFRRLILTAGESTGKRVVVLVDEYDKPLLDCIHDETLHEAHSQELQGFYSVLKECDAHIRFALLTGVGKFGHVSIFSGLNNLRDISLNPKYNALCGISESEFRADFGASIRRFAESNGVSEDEAWETFRQNYDGYHFARTGEGLYNPFSVLNAFADNEIKAYWFRSGTPSMLIGILRRYPFPLNDLEGSEVSESELSDITRPADNLRALFYQTGYMTIKGYDSEFGLYRLGFPNLEVKSAFWDVLYRDYVAPGTSTAVFGIKNFIMDVRRGRPDDFMKRLQSLIASISPGVERKKEIHFQNILEVVFKLLGLSVETEVTMASGRCDMIVRTADFVYLMEFKIDSTPQAALAQIREKGYARQFASDHRRIYLIGANFSTASNTLDSYLIENA